MARLRTIPARLLGHDFRLLAHDGLFSADRVDDGTLLLLAHLPTRPPESVLDLGCGYGALGMPVAARHPTARCRLVDRDLLAVHDASENARRHSLALVECSGSLGYRDLGPGRFDWVLCNVPARIGESAIAYMLAGGASRLTPEGEMRVVVIRDLGPVVERIASDRQLTIRREGEGSRHFVYSVAPKEVPAEDHETFYRLDSVRLADQTFERPHDVNEDQPHLREGIPLLIDCLPRSPTAALTWRAGYGPIPVELARRGAQVTAADRDLLALTFVRRNAAAIGLAVGIQPSAFAPVDRPTSLFVGELYANAGDDALAEQLRSTRAALARNGQALWLSLTRTAKALAPVLTELGATTVASRGAYSVLRIGAARDPKH